MTIKKFHICKQYNNNSPQNESITRQLPLNLPKAYIVLTATNTLNTLCIIQQDQKHEAI